MPSESGEDATTQPERCECGGEWVDLCDGVMEWTECADCETVKPHKLYQPPPPQQPPVEGEQITDATARLLRQVWADYKAARTPHAGSGRDLMDKVVRDASVRLDERSKMLEAAASDLDKAEEHVEQLQAENDSLRHPELDKVKAERDRIEQLAREKMVERDEAEAKLALVDDAIQRVAFFDDAGQAAILSHEQMHKHHADEPYIGCVFCYPEFVLKADLDQQERFKWKANARAEAAEAENKRLREALRASANGLHDLSEAPMHLRHTFDECPDWRCRKARSLLTSQEETE